MIYSGFSSSRQCLVASWGLSTQRLPWRTNALITKAPLSFLWLLSHCRNISGLSQGGMSWPCPLPALQGYRKVRSLLSPGQSTAVVPKAAQMSEQNSILWRKGTAAQPDPAHLDLYLKKLLNQRAILWGCSSSECLQIFEAILLSANVSEEKHDYTFCPQLRGVNSFLLNSAKVTTLCWKTHLNNLYSVDRSQVSVL